MKPGHSIEKTRTRSWNARSRQHGQALIEVALSALLVLIPTFIFGWALYAYGQARTSALNGARYAAWERTVWSEKSRSTSEIENLMVTRFFGKPDTLITSAPDQGASNAGLPSFYSVHNADKVVDVERTAQTKPGDATRPTLRLGDSGEQTSTVGNLYNKFSSVMSFLGADKMKLEDQGLYVAEVNLNLNAIRGVDVLKDLNLNVTQRAAVVVDGWNAGGKAHEEAVVKPLVPMSLLGEVLEWFDPFIEIMGEWTPFSEFKPGCIRGDVVPKDMLPSGSSQAGGKCN